MKVNEKGKMTRRLLVTGPIGAAVEKLLPKTPKPGEIYFANPDILNKRFPVNGREKVWINTSEVNFINLGVMHEKEQLDKQLELTPMGEILEAADLILLESSPDGGYFDLIYNQYKTSINKIINFDKSNNDISTIFGVGSDFFVAFSLINSLSVKDFEQAVKQFLLTIGIANYGLMIPMFLELKINELSNNDFYTELNPITPNHVVDGRTVFMTLEVMKVKSQFPNSKIVCISGQAHAQEIHRYLNTKQGQLEFKKFLYGLFYGWLKLFKDKKWDKL